MSYLWIAKRYDERAFVWQHAGRERTAPRTSVTARCRHRASHVGTLDHPPPLSPRRNANFIPIVMRAGWSRGMASRSRRLAGHS
jgi:hypothetical protein